MSKWNKFINWFDKEEDTSFSCHAKLSELGTVKQFYLYLNNLKIGELSYCKNQWYFKYSEDFIQNIDNFNLIVGFPDINKTYCSDELWPFFKIRIPGLKQPKVKEILKKENIDIQNDVKLLERFGKRTISNPYELEACV